MTSNMDLWRRVSDVLRYDPESGLLYWKARVGSSSAVGEVAGSPHNRGYWSMMLDGKSYLAHRIAWMLMTGEMPENQIDHINGIKSDNRWSNLRVVTNAENRQNIRKARSDNRSGLLGVKILGSKYQARIMLNGKSTTLGVYQTAELAHAAYINAKRQIHPKGQL